MINVIAVMALALGYIAAGIVIFREVGGLASDYSGTGNYFSREEIMVANQNI